MEPFRNILAIRFMRLGDVVLLLPALHLLKMEYPNARLTLLTDERCVDIARMCPAVDHVISMDRLGLRDGPKVQSVRKIVQLVRSLRRERFDLVIDFMGFGETNILAWLLRPANRLGIRRLELTSFPGCFSLGVVREEPRTHVSDLFRQVVRHVCKNAGTEVQISKLLNVPSSLRAWAESIAAGRKILTMYVGAPVDVRRWPAARFAAVASDACESLDASIVVLAGPSDRDHVREVMGQCQRRDRVQGFTDLGVPQLVALIAQSRMLLSNDTGPMHIGPAVGVPTLGLFSVGYPDNYRPLGARSRFLRREKIEDISTESVKAAVSEMWREFS